MAITLVYFQFHSGDELFILCSSMLRPSKRKWIASDIMQRAKYTPAHYYFAMFRIAFQQRFIIYKELNVLTSLVSFFLRKVEKERCASVCIPPD